MALRDSFKKAQQIKNLSNVSADEIALEVESVGYHEADVIKDNRFIPRVEFADPANFARYGQASEYYDQAIKRIYNTYPYDGSLKEKLEWENNSSYIDLYVFDNRYPRSTGYALFSADGWGSLDGSKTSDGYGTPSSLEYISIKGGPHVNPNGMSPSYALTFTGSNYYDTGSNRASNLEFDMENNGVSVEFWLQKDAFDTDKTQREVIFDLWNGDNSGSAGYGRLKIEIDGGAAATPFLITCMSGAHTGTAGHSAKYGFETASIGSDLTVSSLTSWAHYAFTFKNNPTDGIDAKLYVNGNPNEEKTIGIGSPAAVTGALKATIGSLVIPPGNVNPSASAGSGKLTGSLDEFRYWKTQRSSKDVGRYWFAQVGGGTNTDPTPGITSLNTVNTELGVYYKFNEGIVGDSSTDSTVLDYSGRVSNGTWTGYDSYSRNTGSAIISSSAATKEFEDPIIYSAHASITALQNELAASASYHDSTNNASIYNSMPAWILEEDAETGNTLKHLTQIMGSYFDTLQLQIESLNKLRDSTYPSGSEKPLPFANRLLESMGLVSPEIFLDADIIEKLADRSEARLYEKTLVDIKNSIYQNVYNNLSFIYKSKGTEKSFRNLIRCFGIDSELIKFNMYANNIEYELQDNITSRVIAKRYVDFNTSASVDATVYQSSSYISGSTNLTGGFAFTTEANIIFPIKATPSDPHYIDTRFLTASLFGAHSSSHDADTAEHLTSYATQDMTNFQVYAIRDELDSTNAKFMLTGTTNGYMPRLTSSLYEDVYDDSHWTLSVRVKPEKYPYVPLVQDPATGSATSNYIIEFNGINMEDGVVVNSFNTTGSITAPPYGFASGSRMFFVGAQRTNFTGSVQYYSDAKIGSLRHWFDYLESGSLLAHARDIENFGIMSPTQYPYPFQPSASFGELYGLDTLALNWDFAQVTSSNAAGGFTAQDASATGSLATGSNYGWLGPLVSRNHTAEGYGFVANDIKAIDKDYVAVVRQNLPEDLQSRDMITIYGAQERDLFTKNTRPTNYSFAFEKSMYQSVSEEMLNYFASMKDMHNLIGQPVNRYRMNYKLMGKARQAFFERVKNDFLDFEKFYEFYKWFDSALSVMLQQLVPASADVAENIRTVVESHALERNKHQNKFPTMDYREPEIIIDSIQTNAGTWAGMQYDDMPHNNPLGAGQPTRRAVGRSMHASQGGWKWRHHPVDDSFKKNLDYWRDRSEKTGPAFGGETQVNKDRQSLDNIIRKNYLQRSNNEPYRFSADEAHSYTHGANGHISARRDAIFSIVFPAGPLKPGTNLPANVALAYGQDTELLMGTNDTMLPPELAKQRLGFKLDAQLNFDNSDEYLTFDGNLVAPFSLYTSSVITGYQKYVAEQFMTGVMITNLHQDYSGGPHKGALQGPFTEQWMGGREYRHVAINQYAPSKTGTNNLDSPADRPEGFRLLLGLRTPPSYGGLNAIGIVGPLYPEPGSPAVRPPYLFHRPKGNLLRGSGVKRPVNIKNILMTTASLSQSISGVIAHGKIGNYQKNYEVVQGGARSLNDPFFNDQSFTFGSGANGVGPSPETVATRGRLPLTASRGGIALNGPVNPSGNLDYELPNRTGANSNKTIIVNRFSAPGSYEAMSLGYLDVAHEEKSVYNALPYRNLSVRGSGSGESGSLHVTDHLASGSTMFGGDNRHHRGLRTLLTLHAGPFGTDADYGSVLSNTYNTVPSYHKVNRNRRRRIETSNNADVGTDPSTVTTGSVYDNWWVQHPIPGAARGYQWITSSLVENSDFFGYTELSGGFTPSLATISASDYGTGFAGGKMQYGYSKRNGIVDTDFPANFAGLNLVIYEPLTCSSNHLGYPLNVPLAGDATSPAVESTYLNVGVAKQGFRASKVNGFLPDGAMLFNSLMLHRNGPYGYPMWKQTRTHDHPVVVYQRNCNIISVRDRPRSFTYVSNVQTANGSLWNAQVTGLKGNSFTSYIEQPLSSRHHPILFAYENKNQLVKSPSIVMKTTWANNLDYWSNENLNRYGNWYKDVKLGQAYETNIGLLLNLTNDNNSLIEYSERIYPREVNAYQNRIRSRTTYTSKMGLAPTATSCSIWNSSRTIRSNGFVVNSQGENVISASAWPLDGRIDFSTTNSQATSSNAGTNDKAGELQNNYSWYHTTGSHPTASATYAMRVPVGKASATGDTVYMGDALWEVGNQSGKQPYLSYEDYMQYVRLTGKDHSIVPEFRIGTHIEDIINSRGGNPLIPLDNSSPGLFEISGADPNNSYDLGNKACCDIPCTDDFYKVYAHTDFLKYFTVVDNDLNQMISSDGDAINKVLLLECSAKLKFLPYKGFYPVERTVELARLFSASYGPSIFTTASCDAIERGQTLRKLQGYRAAMTPFFGPGILYNSIKSGIAVGSYVVFSADDNVVTDIAMSAAGGGQALDSANSCLPEGYINFGSGSILSMSREPKTGQTSGSFNYGVQRLEFESLYQVDSALQTGRMGPISGNFIYDSGIGSASLSSSDFGAGSGRSKHLQNRIQFTPGRSDPRYSLAIDNFLCESSNFFMKKDASRPNGLTTFISAPEAEWGVTDKNKAYALTVNLYRTLDPESGRADTSAFEMYNRASSFGQPFALDTDSTKASASIRPVTDGGVDETIGAFSASFAPVTPPYFYGTSSCTIIFTSSIGIAPTYEEIIANAEFQYSRHTEAGITGSLQAGNGTQDKQDYVEAVGHWFAMQLTSSIKVSDTIQVGGSRRWMIQSKWETPLLNFAGVNVTEPAVSANPGHRWAAYTDWNTSITSSGMWHQFGGVPDDSSKGVFISLSEPAKVTAFGQSFRGSNVESLATVLGLEDYLGKPRRIGAVADEQLLEEALIVVPFIEVRNEKNFFNFSAGHPAWARSKDILEKYILPPKFDFILNDVDPVLFYAFEFNLTIERDDLVKLWQNVMFDSGSNSSNFHEVENACTDSRKQTCACCIEDQELIKQMYFDNLQWLVFKAKKRAEKDYSSYTKRGIRGASFTPNITEKYSYNWPYDYFSIVELVKIDATARYDATSFASTQRQIGEAPLITNEMRSAVPSRASIALPATAGGGSAMSSKTLGTMGPLNPMEALNLLTGGGGGGGALTLGGTGGGAAGSAALNALNLLTGGGGGGAAVTKAQTGPLSTGATQATMDLLNLVKIK